MRNPTDYACGFNIRHFGVGTHSYNFINDRWGGEFHYVKGWFDAEISTGWASGGLIQSNTFSIAPGSDKATQWKFAYAPPDRPLEVGVFGTEGNYMLHGAGIAAPPNVDHYDGVVEYVQRDPVGWVPGVFAYNLTTTDSNPGVMGYLGAVSRDYAVEAYEVAPKGLASIDFRDETSLVEGKYTHSFTIGVNTQIPRVNYLFARLDINMGGYSSAIAGCSYAGATTKNCQGRAPDYGWVLQYEGPIVPFHRPAQQVAAASTNTSAASAGLATFTDKCMACHQQNGQGIAGAFPALAGNKDVLADDPSAIIATVKHGKGAMPAFGSQLSNAEIAAVLTYVRSAWGNTAAPVTEAEVAGVK